jgi:hypothetical protein
VKLLSRIATAVFDFKETAKPPPEPAATFLENCVVLTVTEVLGLAEIDTAPPWSIATAFALNTHPAIVNA